MAEHIWCDSSSSIEYLASLLEQLDGDDLETKCWFVVIVIVIVVVGGVGGGVVVGVVVVGVVVGVVRVVMVMKKLLLSFISLTNIFTTNCPLSLFSLFSLLSSPLYSPLRECVACVISYENAKKYLIDPTSLPEDDEFEEEITPLVCFC